MTKYLKVWIMKKIPIILLMSAVAQMFHYDGLVWGGSRSKSP